MWRRQAPRSIAILCQLQRFVRQRWNWSVAREAPRARRGQMVSPRSGAGPARGARADRGLGARRSHRTTSSRSLGPGALWPGAIRPKVSPGRRYMGIVHDEAASRPRRCLTPKLSCKRLAQYPAHLDECTSIAIGGNHNDLRSSRACQLQRHVRRHVYRIRRAPASVSAKR